MQELLIVNPLISVVYSVMFAIWSFFYTDAVLVENNALFFSGIGCILKRFPNFRISRN